MLVLSRCFSIGACSSFWRTLLHVLFMPTAASCSTSGLRAMNWVLCCIYIQLGLCTRLINAIYAYIKAKYTYIGPCKHIYRLYIYVFYAYLLIFMPNLCCICANILQMYAILCSIAYHSSYSLAAGCNSHVSPCGA